MRKMADFQRFGACIPPFSELPPSNLPKEKDGIAILKTLFGEMKIHFLSLSIRSTKEQFTFSKPKVHGPNLTEEQLFPFGVPPLQNFNF